MPRARKPRFVQGQPIVTEFVPGNIPPWGQETAILPVEVFEAIKLSAHPGIVKIVDHVQAIFKENIYLLIGGFHLMNTPPQEIRKIAKRLRESGVERIAPCHCSGDTTRELFRSQYKENYIECAAGLVLEIPGIQDLSLPAGP